MEKIAITIETPDEMAAFNTLLDTALRAGGLSAFDVVTLYRRKVDDAVKVAVDAAQAAASEGGK